MNKRGQVTETLLYVAAGVITAIVIYYGVSSIIGFRAKGTEAESILLKEGISTDVARMSIQLGAERNFSYLFPAQFNEICYVDISKKNEIMENISAIINADTSILNNKQIIEIINDSISSNSTNNVFLFGQATEAFSAGSIQVCKKPIKCFQAYRGTARAEMFGGGGFALLEPCAPNRAPVVMNETGKHLLLLVGINYSFGDPIIIGANATDYDGELMDIDWYITNTTRNTTKYRTVTKSVPGGVISGGISVIEDVNYTLLPVSGVLGTYRASVVAIDNSSKVGSTSFDFRITIANPENLPPFAVITYPQEGSSFNPGIPIFFEGNISDPDSENLTYEWDFGDGFTSSGKVTITPGEDFVSQPPPHSYAKDGNYSIVLIVRDNESSYASDPITITIGNTVPQITIIRPLDNAVVPNNVNFTFHVMDNEQTALRCLITLVNSTGFINSITIGQVLNDTNASIIQVLPGGNYSWSASCSDGFGTGSSPTYKFTVAAAPVLSCFIASGCSASTPIFSISSLTNAHAAQDTSFYPNKVCCNLTTGNLITTSGAKVLNLSSTTNAHAESPTAIPSFYPVPVYMGTTAPGVSINCRATIPLGSCGTDTCVVALSSGTNAHVEDCNSGLYPIKICCNATG